MVKREKGKDAVEYAGTPVKSEDMKKGKVLSFTWKPKLDYSWATGAAIGHFLRELKEGRIVGRLCIKCERILVPPRMFCEQCFRETDEWVEVMDTGTVNTFSITYIAFDRSRLKEPLIPAVIEIDGASQGMGFLHLLSEVKPEDVNIGMQVQAVWKPEKERTGDITDIMYFRPVGSGQKMKKKKKEKGKPKKSTGRR